MKIERIVWTQRFKRAYIRRIKGTVYQALFEFHLDLFTENPFSPQLRTHKLSGSLDGLWSFSVAYDCRVVFKFIADKEVHFMDIGSHEEVY